MRLFLLGATGKTGTQVVDVALARGHEVTAFVRSPEKLATVDGLRAVRGDPRDAEAIAAALPGHDAVLSALGAPVGQAFRPHTLVADCATATVHAMRAAGVKRLGIVSAAVLFPEKGLQFTFFRWVLKQVAADLRAMEATVGASGLDWTIVRPPRLVQTADLRHRTQRDRLPSGGRAVSCRAVATFLVDAIEQGAWSRAIVGVAR